MSGVLTNTCKCSTNTFISLGSGSPSAQVVAILRPAALSYLEIESTFTQNSGDEDPFPSINRTNIETDFELSQKSYSLTINAVSMLATNRPTFFKDSAICLARRAIDPPSSETTTLTKAGILTVQSHLRASCLTLLRNSLSVTTGASDLLHKALASDICKMKIQADKAMNMATQAAHLKKAGRAARNRAAVFYEWDQSKGDEIDDASKKRKAAGHDALEKMRIAKLARGLGNGIQLPTSMADACELILLNLSNLPSSRAVVTAKEKKTSTDQKKRKKLNFDYFVDAIISNGASLISDENRWYQRDGGDVWMMEIASLVSEDEMDVDGQKKDLKSSTPAAVSFTLDTSTLDESSTKAKDKKSDAIELYKNQCNSAAADAFERILLRTKSARDATIISFGNEIAARLAWSLDDVKPSRSLKSLATSTITSDQSQNNFSDQFPLVSSCLAFDLETFNSSSSESKSIDPSNSLTNRVLNEAYINEICENQNVEYGQALEYYISSILESCKKADDKPNDNVRKKLASSAAASLPQQLAILPSLPLKSLELTSAICDIDNVTKKAIEASRKTSNKNLTQAATAHGKSMFFMTYRFILIHVMLIKC